MRVHLDANACQRVIQLSNTNLSRIPLGQNVTMRPGTVFTGILSDPARYVIARGGLLRRLNPTGLGVFLAPEWLLDDRTALLPDFVFTDYRSGTEVTNSSQYDGRIEYQTTLDNELGLAP
jgi:hypothetical protein